MMNVVKLTSEVNMTWKNKSNDGVDITQDDKLTTDIVITK